MVVTTRVWVRQLRQDCTRQHLPQFKSRLFFVSMYRFPKLLKKMPFNVIPPQVQGSMEGTGVHEYSLGTGRTAVH